MLRAQRQPGSRELFELNPKTLTLTVVRLPDASPTTYQLRYWPQSQPPTVLAVNSLGSLAAIGSSTGTLLVVRIPAQKGHVFEEIEFSEGHGLRGLKALAWHPLSATDSHLVALTRNGRLSLFDCAAAARMPDEEALCRLSSGPEQTIFLSTAAVSETAFVSDGWSAICFGSEAEATDSPWQWLTAFVVRESGDIWTVCPFLPGTLRIRRTVTFEPLKRHLSTELACIDQTGQSHEERTGRLASLKHQQTFVEMLEQRAEAIAHVSGLTDWLVIDWKMRLGAFGHLAPKPQGPLLVEPEPLEVASSSGPGYALDEARHAWCFAIGTMAGLAVAYRSGRVDLLATCADIEPQWQLDIGASARGCERKRPVSDPGSVFALLESVHVRGGSNVEDALCRDGKNVVLRSRKTAVCVSVAMNEDFADDGPNGSIEDCTVSWECKAWLLAEAGTAEELCAVEMDSGADMGGDWIARVFAFENNGRLLLKTETPLSGSTDLANAVQATAGHNRVLQAMDGLSTAAALDTLCPGALQLESLQDELARTLARLVHARREAFKGLSGSAVLPEGIDEPWAVALNDHVAAWEADLVAPALRFGHELSLRIGVLAAALQQQRQVLLRARELLTEKPGRLRRLLNVSAQLALRQTRLASRVSELRTRLAGPSFDSSADLGSIGEELQVAHDRLEAVMHTVQNRQACASPDPVAFLKMQLNLQSSLLSRLRLQLSQD